MNSYKKASFLDDFELPEITHDAIKSELIKLGRVHSVQKRKTIEGLPLTERLEYISNEVNKILGRYKNFVKIIDNYADLDKYIDFAIDKIYLAFDTETNNSLDPLTCKLMGLCFYIPNTKPVYVPINHCKPGTDELLDNQVSMEEVTEIFKKLKNSNVRMIYHNGKFDIRVCYNTTGIYLPIYWDTMIAAQLLDENELARLKYQYKTHVNPTLNQYNIEKLFTGLPYAWIPVDIFALYAAIDAYDTYNLMLEQKNVFEKDGLDRLYNVFTNIEMPIVGITAKMEDTGVCVDLDYLNRLSNKYITGLYNAVKQLNEILEPYSKQISYYQSLGKLDTPVNFESSQQLQILMYDILKLEPIEDKGRSTAKAELKAFDIPFTNALLDYRHYSVLMKTFIKPTPERISTRDGKLHTNFNQMGAEENNVRTGRFSSTNPNLQNIPSKSQEVRLMFKASEEFNNVSADDTSNIVISNVCEIETPNGYIKLKELKIGDIINVYLDDNNMVTKIVDSIKLVDSNYHLEVH